ncbi:peptidoglycan-binding domain-containing protein [Streptacidiphilus melanogenes]|uniref:peptidoglycan-binding domain-containing protein n=1 Tax=Streptacidiphilus melanogenes TaxID=411235 RepID=UPI0006941076|nr:peptidoglycan-binding domain-containing protein [Streptacidiphilus melanogenes]
MEPQPELVRPYVTALSGETDMSSDLPEPPEWPTPAARRVHAPVRPAVGRVGGRPLQPAQRGLSRGLTAALALGALAAVGLVVAVTTDGGGGPHKAASGSVAAPAALPTSGGSATSAATTAAASRSAHPVVLPAHGTVATAAPQKSASATPTASQPAPAAADGTLRPGDRGPAVVRLQQLLFQQGFTYVAVTGVYDAATTRGVTQLQQDRGITGDPTGVYGPRSRAALDPGQ